MTTYPCNKCKEVVIVPSFTEEEVLHIWGLKQKNLPLFAIRDIRKMASINLVKVKAFYHHLNTTHGQCHNCGETGLQNENSFCPKCQAFNINWKIACSFNESFCIQLESRLSAVFRLFDNQHIQGFWCDGVSWIPEDFRQLAQKCISQNRHIKTHAWLGTDGQTVYQMKIKLGEKSLEQYLQKENMEDCIPDTNSTNWVRIDLRKKTIAVRLL